MYVKTFNMFLNGNGGSISSYDVRAQGSTGFTMLAVIILKKILGTKVFINTSSLAGKTDHNLISIHA